MAVKKSAIRKIVKALRSGKYKQLTNRMYQNGAYCVWGAIEKELSGKIKDVFGPSEKVMNFIGVVYSDEIAISRRYLSNYRSYRDFKGSKHELYDDDTKKISIMTLNDTLYLTFPQIADALEKEYLK